MAGRSSRRRAKVEKLDAAEEASPSSSSPSSRSSSYSDCVSQRKIPLPDRRQQQSIKDGEDEEEEKPSPRRVSRDPQALRKLLLSILRSYYIDAISRLPTDLLRTTLARGLLVGGHCYGPFRPVENIIINSVWYAAAFPFRCDPIDVAVITAEPTALLMDWSPPFATNALPSPTMTPYGTSASPAPTSTAQPPPYAGPRPLLARNWKPFHSRWLPRRRGTQNLPPSRSS